MWIRFSLMRISQKPRFHKTKKTEKPTQGASIFCTPTFRTRSVGCRQIPRVNAFHKAFLMFFINPHSDANQVFPCAPPSKRALVDVRWEFFSVSLLEKIKTFTRFLRRDKWIIILTKPFAFCLLIFPADGRGDTFFIGPYVCFVCVGNMSSRL